MRTYGFIKSNLIGNEPNANRILPKVSLPSAYRLTNLPPVIDQGNKPICVSACLSNMIRWNNKLYHVDTKFSDSLIYEQCSYSSNLGMSPKDALETVLSDKVANLIGHKYKLYAKVTSSEMAKQAILQNGPILVALPVCNETSTFWIGNTALGYHAALLVGYNINNFTLMNSWGISFGNNGFVDFPVNGFDEFVLEAWTLIS